jgi:hypothetical protein
MMMMIMTTMVSMNSITYEKKRRSKEKKKKLPIYKIGPGLLKRAGVVLPLSAWLADPSIVSM